MTKLRTTESNLLDIILCIMLFAIIALLFSVIKSCTTKNKLKEKDISEIYEMIDYHGSIDYLTMEENGFILIKK